MQPADIAPSILEMAGIAAPAEMEMQGHSWLPLIDGRKRSIRPAAISADLPGQWGIDEDPAVSNNRWAVTVSTLRWQLIDFPDPAWRELYDLSAPGGSQQNVITGNEDVAERLHRNLLAVLDRHDPGGWMYRAFRDGADAAKLPPLTEFRENVLTRRMTTHNAAW